MRVELICVSDRPESLPLLMHALRLQTYTDWLLTVYDQSDDGVCEAVALDLASRAFKRDPRVRAARVNRVGDWGQQVKAAAAEVSTAEILGFPNDDAYYCPLYLQLMVEALDRGFDLAYCDWVFDKYGYVGFQAFPKVGHVDVGGFLVRAETARRVGWKSRAQTGDGEFVEAVVASGAPHVRVPGLLYVKN